MRSTSAFAASRPELQASPYSDRNFAVPHEHDFRVSLCVIAAVTFNFGLCLVNANVGGLGRGIVIAAELVIVSAALALSCRNWRPDYRPWLAYLGGTIVLWLVLSLMRQNADPKLVRDILIIP